MVISWAEFLPMVVVVSASGVMSPGPLTFATIASGSKRGWKAGPSIGLGHLIVELPLVFVIAMGATFISSIDLRWVSLGGGLFMVIFGFLTVRGARGLERKARSPGYRDTLLWWESAYPP